ncbi:chlorophyll synthase ChlG [Jiella sp. MQZ9-1]|uniref:Chlorophyll synthase ChlG n=1 Tax=Jiella flava TaxID=2816857 RepID=A0A939FWK8_9HYPH|nr:chlorophyll synthase ChlG [Jiella flava]MBO0663308.1 chlorophyll synthase ChlG [Jiella flava]MCD2471884.1 chlorophyll synthase ChlG [Jiella flava]
MSRLIVDSPATTRPSLSAGIELLKPITWFAPMWAFGCGAISARSSAPPHHDTVWIVLAGVVLAGPLLCGASQAVNDWFDRHVDAINEPNRPIPSGRMPGRSALYVAIVWTALSLVVAGLFGPWVGLASCLGCLLAWAYSAPPLRLKRNGWWGNAAVAFAYEGLAWFTGAAVVASGLPDARIIVIACLYSIGAHGIMTLNDFKAIEGDVALGVRTLPVQYGVKAAALIACGVMAVPQIMAAGLLFAWSAPISSLIVTASIAVQLGLMRHFVNDPRSRAPWYNATGTSLYVAGMMVTAFALSGIIGS